MAYEEAKYLAEVLGTCTHLQTKTTYYSSILQYIYLVNIRAAVHCCCCTAVGHEEDEKGGTKGHKQQQHIGDNNNIIHSRATVAVVPHIHRAISGARCYLEQAVF